MLEQSESAVERDAPDEVGALAGDLGARREGVEGSAAASRDGLDATRTTPAPEGDARALTVLVESERGDPLAGASVTILVPEATDIRGETGADGTVRLARPDLDRMVTVRAELEGRYAAKRDVRFGLDTTRLTLPAAAEMAVRVVDGESGAALPGVRVVVWGPNLQPSAALDVTDESGRTGTLRVPAEYACQIEMQEQGYLGVRRRLTSPPAGGREEQTVELVPSAPLEVRLFAREGGHPVFAASVTHRLPGGMGRSSWTAQPDHEGVVALQDVAPRAYVGAAVGHEASLFVRAVSYCSMKVVVDEARLGPDRRIDVPLVKSNRVIIRASSSVSSLDGRVLRAVYKTERVGHASRAWDHEAFPWPDGQRWDDTNGYEFEVTLRADGSGLIRDLPPGLYGIDLYSTEEPSRLLAEVGPFAGAGEQRVVHVSL